MKADSRFYTYIKNQIWVFLELTDRTTLSNIKRVCEQRINEIDVNASIVWNRGWDLCQESSDPCPTADDHDSGNCSNEEVA